MIENIIASLNLLTVPLLALVILLQAVVMGHFARRLLLAECQLLAVRDMLGIELINVSKLGEK